MSLKSLSFSALLALALAVPAVPSFAVTSQQLPCDAIECHHHDPEGGPDGPGNPYVPPPTPLYVAPNDRPQLIDCRIPGSVETADLTFRNIGEGLIPAETPIYWIVKGTDAHGTFSLPVDLPPGREIRQADLLGGVLPPADHCLSRIL